MAEKQKPTTKKTDIRELMNSPIFSKSEYKPRYIFWVFDEKIKHQVIR